MARGKHVDLFFTYISYHVYLRGFNDKRLMIFLKDLIEDDVMFLDTYDEVQ